MEARIARLESDVGHMRTDVGDIKVDLRSLRDKVDSVGAQLSARIDAKFVRVYDSISSARIWALTLYIAFAAATFGTMARGFGWM